jgi:protein gp37
MPYYTRFTYVGSTFNPVWGCTPVSAGCSFCRVAIDAHKNRIRCCGNDPRKEFGDVHWREPVRWDIEAGALHRTRTVLCGDHCDIFDPDWPEGTHTRLWALQQVTPRLFWLNLTKRIENAAALLPARWLEQEFPANVGLGVTVENADYLGRLDALAGIPAAFRWLRADPLIGPFRLEAKHEFLSWVVVNATSSTQPEWMLDLMVSAIEMNIPVYVSRNSAPPVEQVRELPGFRRILITGLLDQRRRRVFPRTEI